MEKNVGISQRQFSIWPVNAENAEKITIFLALDFFFIYQTHVWKSDLIFFELQSDFKKKLEENQPFCLQGKNIGIMRDWQN